MSINTPNAYSPPPPPRRGLSPWAWVGIGCAGVTVLGFGGCIAVAVTMKNRIESEMRQPFNPQQAVQAIGDIPQYPNAQIDEVGSKAARAGLRAMSFAIPAKSSAVLALRVEDPDEKIFKWYDTKMQDAGYKIQNGRETTGRNVQHQYRKDRDMVIVQVQRGQRSTGDGKLIVLMRFDGMKK